MIGSIKAYLGCTAAFAALFVVVNVASGQEDVLSYMRLPAAPQKRREVDPLHPPPRPYSKPDYRMAPSAPAPPILVEDVSGMHEEDTDNLLRLWEQRPSMHESRQVLSEALSMPSEPRNLNPFGNPGQAGPGPMSSPVGGSWSQIGSGDYNSDGIHHEAGRIRQATYAYDNAQSQTVLWVGATGGGLWRAVVIIPFGGVFVPVSDNLPGSPSVGAFLVQPGNSNNILIGTGDSYRYSGTGMYKTTDEGATWTAVFPTDGTSWPGAFQKILIDVNDTTNQTVLAEGDSGIWRSTDFGSTWTQVYSGSASDLVQDPNADWIWYAGAPGVGVLRSTDYGKSFSPIGSGISTPIGRVSVALSAAASWHVYALTEGKFGVMGGIWRSDNYGAGTWVSLDPKDKIGWGQAFHTCAINVDPSDADRLWVGMGGMQVTSNATAASPTWKYDTGSGGTFDGGHADHTCFTFEPGTTTVIGGCDGGVYSWDYTSLKDSGALNLNTGLNCQQVLSPPNCLAGSRTLPDRCLAGLQDNQLVLIEGQNTPTIQMVGQGGDGGCVSISPDNGSTMVGITNTYRMYSTDTFSTYNYIDFALQGKQQALLIDQTPGRIPSYIYTQSDSNVYFKTNDTSNDWAPVNSKPLPSTWNTRVLDAACDLTGGNYVFYLTAWSTGKMIVMDGYSDGTVGSMSWEYRTPKLATGAWNSECHIAADRSTLSPYTVTYVTGASRPSQAFLSNDRGKKWKEVTGDLATNLPNANYWKLIANPGDQRQLFLATDQGVYRSDNGGVNWYKYGNGLPAVTSVLGLELNYDNSTPPTLNAGTNGRGFWVRLVEAGLASLTLKPTSVTGGISSKGTVELNGPAPTGGAEVTLSTSDADAAGPPATVTVPAGSTSASFTISTKPVASKTAVTITAAYRYGVSLHATLTVKAPALASVTLKPGTVTGGKSSIGTVKLTGAVATGASVTVSLVSSDPSVAAVPSTVTIPAGASAATFTITTSPVAAQTKVTISATYAGIAKSAILTVDP